MTVLGLVKQPAETTAAPAKVVPELTLQVEDALASAGRLWVRGRLIDGSVAAVNASEKLRWWGWWRRKPETSTPPPLVRLETRISGHLFETEIPLKPDGRFEASFSADLPVARRGWRIARNRVTWANKTAEKCGVVVTPPDGARGGAVVILPLDFTAQAHGAQRLARSELAARLTPVLRRLQRGPSGVHAIYYAACVPPQGDARQAELALAITTLGWPAGSFLLLPVEQDALNTLSAGLDRLRWLFAGTAPLWRGLQTMPQQGALDLLVVNLEPSFAEALPLRLQPKTDRAPVRRLLNPPDDPETLFSGQPRATIKVAGAAIRPTRAGFVPRYPVVFCHGMLAMTTLRMQLPADLNCFSPLREFLHERGFRALFPQVAPTSGVVARARQLREQILRWTDEPVNLVAHSMGGLDARYLITHLGLAERVRSLTTIATPHHGTRLVEWFLANFRNRVPLLLAMEAMGVNVDGFRDCLPSACRTLNACTPDMPGVRYFSYAGCVSSGHVTPILRRAWNLLNAMEGPNDGMVSVESARWGECLGVVHADHFAQTPDRVFVRPGEDFDALGFYFRLLEDLARRGF